MSSNPMPRSARSFAFLASSQAKTFTQDSVAQCVPNRHTLASAKLYPETIYPARAGETATRTSATLSRRVHPRACGGNLVDLVRLLAIRGPSPRVRGKLALALVLAGLIGSIPARAGETDYLPLNLSTTQNGRCNVSPFWALWKLWESVYGFPRGCGKLASLILGLSSPAPSPTFHKTWQFPQVGEANTALYLLKRNTVQILYASRAY